MKKIIILFFSILMVSPALAAKCPSIKGNWAVTYDEVYAGYTYAGAGVVKINSNLSFNSNGWETYRGDLYSGKISGKFKVKSDCRLEANYQGSGGGKGKIRGAIVNKNKLFLIYVNTAADQSGRVIAERIIK